MRQCCKVASYQIKAVAMWPTVPISVWRSSFPGKQGRTAKHIGMKGVNLRKSGKDRNKKGEVMK